MNCVDLTFLELIKRFNKFFEIYFISIGIFGGLDKANLIRIKKLTYHVTLVAYIWQISKSVKILRNLRLNSRTVPFFGYI